MSDKLRQDLSAIDVAVFDGRCPDRTDTRDFIPCRYCNGTLPEVGEMQHEATCPWNLGKLDAVKAMERGHGK